MSAETGPGTAELRVDPRSWWRDRWWQRKRHHCLRPRTGATGDSWTCPECGEQFTYGEYVVYGPPPPSDRHDDGETWYEGWHR